MRAQHQDNKKLKAIVAEELDKDGKMLDANRKRTRKYAAVAVALATSNPSTHARTRAML